MTTFALRRTLLLGSALGLLLACGGGGGDGTGPATVAQVVITAPASAPTFGALGRTAQFSAQAQDDAGAPVTASITWSSSNTAAATVSGSGLVTAVANGTAQVRASAGGVQSAPVTVTVSQVPVQVVVTPGSVNFGALGSTRQLSAGVLDSTDHPISGASVTWSRNGPGTTASVSGTGLVTALANGAGDTAVATAGALAGKAPITVAQLTASVTVTSTSATPDTLRTTGSTRQFSATARDSNGNVVASATPTWGTSASGVATVSGTGLVSAVADGSTTITATAGGISGTRPVVVQRYAATFSLTPGSASITTNAGTATLNGTAQDSNATALTIAWTSKSTAVATVSPASGSSTTVTATGNGTTYVVMSSGTRRDSAQITVSGQTTVSFASGVQPIFTANCALSGCHNGSGGALPGVMNLSPGNAYNAIVNVNSLQNPALKRVAPGDVANSYLARKIDPTVGAISGGQMPAVGSLTAQEIQTIKNWIAQGAPNN